MKLKLKIKTEKTLEITGLTPMAIIVLKTAIERADDEQIFEDLKIGYPELTQPKVIKILDNIFELLN